MRIACTTPPRVARIAVPTDSRSGEGDTMASLHVLKGGTPGQVLTLDKPKVVLGREQKDCDYVIPNQAVSRVHAQISLVQGRHFIEDLKSRNKTYVNNKLVETPV